MTQLGVALLPAARQHDMGGAQNPEPHCTPTAPWSPPDEPPAELPAVGGVPAAADAPAVPRVPAAPLTPAGAPAAPTKPPPLPPLPSLEVQPANNVAAKSAVPASDARFEGVFGCV